MISGAVSYKNLTLPNGAPFPAGSANNGLSVDAGGLIVLGNDVGDLLQPALLLSNREIPTNGNYVQLIDAGNVARLQSTGVEVIDNNNNIGLIAAGFLTLGTDDGSAVPAMYMYDISLSNPARFVIAATGLDFQNGGGRRFFTYDEANFRTRIGDPDFAGSGMTLYLNSNNGSAVIGANRDHLLIDDPADTCILGNDIYSGIFPGNGAQIVLDNTTQKNYLWNGATQMQMDGTAETIELSALNGVNITNSALTGFISINGTPGFTGTVTPVTSITVEGGIVTAVS